MATNKLKSSVPKAAAQSASKKSAKKKLPEPLLFSETKSKITLCNRCEHRARFIEENMRPRYECGNVGQSVYACYMFMPVQPIEMAPAHGDRRPVAGPWMFSARCYAIGLANVVTEGYRTKKGVVLLWSKKKRA